MRSVAALLAAVALGAGLTACGDGGAEPGAPRSATLILDFQPNAVHAGIYTALRRGIYEDEGVKLTVREPSESTDAPKLLRAGKADFAILDIHDLGIAREKGFDVVGIAPIVQRPLAAVIARGSVKRPRELEGKRVGVTGLPSDDAVLDSVVKSDGGDPRKVKRVTIGFKAVPALAAGRVDAVTAFWNAEGVQLRGQGVETNEFRVDRYGAPRYPELVLVTSRERLQDDRETVAAVARGTVAGYEKTLADPGRGLDDLAGSVRGIDRRAQKAELDALLPALRLPGRLDARTLEAWGRWDASHGILERPPDVERAFELNISEDQAG